MKYDYPSGVLPEEVGLVERFERDVLPYTMKHGGEIGEAAMMGDVDAEEIIRRQHLFVGGMPSLRGVNLSLLTAALKRWDQKRTQ